MSCCCAALGAARTEILDDDAYRHTGQAVIAMRAVSEGTAAPESCSDQFAVHRSVNQVAGRGDL